jgi:hypothetical protein
MAIRENIEAGVRAIEIFPSYSGGAYRYSAGCVASRETGRSTIG